jgi:hemerythrin-like domain-containing protein
LLYRTPNPLEHRPSRTETEMDAIETLMNEHRVIERVLDGLVAFADEVRRKGSTEKEELGRFVTFVREFADACHHGKEEDILFAAMIEAGFPRESGPIAVMLRDHDAGRALVGLLRERALQDAPWTDGDRQEIVEAAHGFSELLRGHIHKEDAILYPMAEQHLPPETLEAVGEACDAYERDEARAGKHEQLHALAEDLVRVHAPTVHPEHAQRPTGFGCCG